MYIDSHYLLQGGQPSLMRRTCEGLTTFRTRVSACAAAALLVVALLLVVAGCGNTPTAAIGGNGDSTSPAPPGPVLPPQLNAVSINQVSSAFLQPRWSLDFDRPVTAAIADDGTWVLIGRSYVASGSEYWGALLYNSEGKQVWSRVYREDRYRTIQVSSLGGGNYFSVALFTYTNPGVAYLYNSLGQRLWSRTVNMSVTLAVDEASGSLFGIDHGKRELFSAVGPLWQSRNLRTVTERSTLEAGNGRVLVTDMSTAMLLDSTGSVIHRQTVPSDFTAVSLAPDGNAVYAATRGADSSVMRFNDRGDLIWSSRIPAAGTNSLVVSPTGQHVMAYNITLDSGFAILDAADGKILCRNTFVPVEDNASQFIRWAMFLPEDDAVLVDYAVARSKPSGHVEEHSLLLFSMAGDLLARFDVGANVDVLVSDDGRACVTVSTVAYDWSGPTPNRVRSYDLTPMFGLRRP